MLLQQIARQFALHFASYEVAGSALIRESSSNAVSSLDTLDSPGHG